MSIFLLHRTKTQNVKYKMLCSNMDETIKCLKKRFFNCIEEPGCDIDFIYRGMILEDEQTLTQSGLEPDVVVHILTKPIPEPELVQPPPTDAQIKQAYKIIGAINSNPHHKAAFLKMNRKDNFEKIMLKHPELKNDPKARTMLLDPYLITTITSMKAVRSLAENHPVLIEALRTIAEILKETKSTSASRISLSMLESIMFDSDSDSTGSEHSAPGPSTSHGSESSQGITANQLSAALALATSASGTSLPDLSRSSHSTTSVDNPVITSSMFNNALTQAMNQSGPSRNPNRFPSRRTNSQPSSSRPASGRQNHYMASLQIMRTMGLTDDIVNIQALEICTGDVEAAVNLILSGVISE